MLQKKTLFFPYILVPGPHCDIGIDNNGLAHRILYDGRRRDNTIHDGFVDVNRCVQTDRQKTDNRTTGELGEQEQRAPLEHKNDNYEGRYITRERGSAANRQGCIVCKWQKKREPKKKHGKGQK